MTKFASLVVLSYNRREMLQRSLETLFASTHAPYELIILDDSSDQETQDYIYELVRAKKVSTALFNCGQNMGLGIQVNRGFQIARGDFLLKLDADLSYTPGWLSHVMWLLRSHERIGCLGLFKYWHPPVHFPDKLIAEHFEKEPHFYEVMDFVGSAICVRREIYEMFGPWFEDAPHNFGEDIAFKDAVQSDGYMLALPKCDLVHNFGFGEHLSSLIKVIDWKGGNHIYNVPSFAPLIFNPGSK